MDPEFLTSEEFWCDREPFAAAAAGVLTPSFQDTPETGSQIWFQTSGSSGTPRWIGLTKEALMVSAYAVNRHLGVDSTSRWGLALPTHHVGGFGVLARARAAGCGFGVFRGKWDPRSFSTWLDEHAITHTSLVPTQVHDLVAAGLRAPAGLLAIVVGGGRLETATGIAARELGWPVLASYGMTEAGSQIATQSPTSLALPYQHAPIPVLDIWDTAIDEQGVLLISGPALFFGQFHHHNGAWHFEKRSSAWYRTQDHASLEGRMLSPLGRADTLVKVLGELVDPEQIEREIASISQGALSPGSFAVAAIQDPRTEHALIPVFEGPIQPLHHSWIEAYNQTAPGFRRLMPPTWIEAIPKSPLGKILRRQLREIISANRAESPN